jgi:hypothetical protein
MQFSMPATNYRSATAEGRVEGAFSLQLDRSALHRFTNPQANECNPGGRDIPAQPVARSPEGLIRRIASVSIQAESTTRAQHYDLLSWCRTRQMAMLIKIEACVAAGKTRAADRLAEQLRRSFAARFIALHESVPDELRARRFSSREEREALRIQALRWVLAQLGPVGKLNVRSRAYVRLKAKQHVPQPGQPKRYPDQLRAIFSFGGLDTARQRLLKASLTPFADFHPSQYMIQDHPEGRGRSGVCEALRLQLPTMDPDTEFLQFDVRNFYGSIDHRWLERKLRLPADVVRNQIHTGSIHILHLRDVHRSAHPSDGVRQELVRRGIPGGSALSTLIAEIVMADVLRGLTDLPDRTRLFTYSDNIGVLCPAASAHVIMDLFRGRFAAHGAGPFEICTDGPIPIKHKFLFLGHRWRLRNNRTEVCVSSEHALLKLVKIGDEAAVASPPELLHLAGYIRWQASEWRMWPGVANWVRDAMGIVKSAAAPFEQAKLTARILDLERRALESVQPVAGSGDD